MQLKKYQRGFSLLEVLIFASIISLFFVAAATLATFSLRNIKGEENKILATRYAEELVEWLRGEKEEDWEGFILNRMGNYCFSKEPIALNTWPTKATTTPICNSSNPAKLIDNLFRRELTLAIDNDNPERVNATINVIWAEGGVNKTIPIKTVFERFGE